MLTPRFRLWFLGGVWVTGVVLGLARGVLEVSEVPNDPHGLIVSNAQGMFHNYRRNHPGTIWRIGGGGEFRLWIPEFVSG